MSSSVARRVRVLAIVLALVAWGCGGDAADEPSSTAEIDTSTVEAAGDDAAADITIDEPTESPAAGTIGFELFSSDEGAGCSVYVAVPEGVVDDSTDVRAMLWEGVVDAGFTSCGFSEVVEAGLITVGALDNYGQPDWSTVTEHGFFAAQGWDDLIESCGTAPVPESCSEQVNLALSP